MQPLVSVLLPTFNAEDTIRAALDSMLRQTFRDFELVVVDDGSSDSTPEIIDSYAARDERVRLERLPHRGIIQTLNAGIALCQADLVARMDADDISHPVRLQNQFEFMTAHPEVSVCSCLVRLFPRRGLLGGLLHYENWMNSLATHEAMARDMFVESPVAHPSVMLRRQDLIELGGYEDRGWAEDYDLWLRYSERGKCFAKLHRTLVWWRHSAERLTFTDSRYSLENFLRAKAHYISRRLSASSSPVLLWGAGKMGRRLLRHLLREGMQIEAVIDIDPKKIDKTLRGRPIVARDYLLHRSDAFVICAVGSSGAREKIREHMTSIGAVEMRDFLCAA